MSDETRQIPGDHYLFGLVAFLLRLIASRFLLMIGLPVLVMAMAYVASGFLKPVYPGQANLQIGRIGGSEIQSRNTVVDRINSSPFKVHVLRALNEAAGQGSSFGQDAVDGLSAQTSQFSDWVTINSRAHTPEQLSKIISTTIGVIQGEHEKIKSSATESLRGQLALANADVANLSNLKQELIRALSTEPQKNADETNIAALLDARQRNALLRDQLLHTDAAMTEAATRQIKLSEQLSPVQTFSTHPLDDIYISSKPASPRRLTITAAAGAVAFFVCLLYVLIWLPKPAHRS
jgi:hypothetical protein